MPNQAAAHAGVRLWLPIIAAVRCSSDSPILVRAEVTVSRFWKHEVGVVLEGPNAGRYYLCATEYEWDNGEFVISDVESSVCTWPTRAAARRAVDQSGFAAYGPDMDESSDHTQEGYAT